MSDCRSLQEEFMEGYACLSVEEQHAVEWILQNFDRAYAICNSSQLTPEERNRYMRGKSPLLRMLTALEIVLHENKLKLPFKEK